MSRPVRNALPLACLALALGLTACGGDDDSEGDEAGGTTTTTASNATSSTDTATDETVAPPSSQPAGAPDTTEGAIARFEDYLHALGAGDIPTICEIAGPAAQMAEEQGFGSCEQTYGSVLEMISPEQAAALRSATVDPAAVDASTPGEVSIPVEAVRASVTFTEGDLGSYRLAYQDGDWFIVE